MDQDGAMPAGDVRIVDHHVVLGRSADRVETEAERIDIFLIHQPAFQSLSRSRADVLDKGFGIGIGPGMAVELLAGQGLHAARIEQGLPSASKVLASGVFEMNAVQARVGHGESLAEDQASPPTLVLSES